MYVKASNVPAALNVVNSTKYSRKLRVKQAFVLQRVRASGPFLSLYDTSRVTASKVKTTDNDIEIPMPTNVRATQLKLYALVAIEPSVGVTVPLDCVAPGVEEYGLPLARLLISNTC